MRWPLTAVKVGDSLNAAFGASPRLHWSVPQAATFSALPWPSVRIVDVRLDDTYGVNAHHCNDQATLIAEDRILSDPRANWLASLAKITRRG